MKKSEEMKRSGYYVAGGIALDRLLQSGSRKYLLMPLWLFGLAVTGAYVGSVAILEWMTSEEDDPYLQEYLEVTFPTDIPFIGMIPWGLAGPTEFALGMQLCEVLPNPVTDVETYRTFPAIQREIQFNLIRDEISRDRDYSQFVPYRGSFLI
jgi:hypothetical protein